MKIKKFGTISMEDDKLVLTKFAFSIDPSLDVDDKETMDKMALMAVIGYLIELMVKRELQSVEQRH